MKKREYGYVEQAMWYINHANVKRRSLFDVYKEPSDAKVQAWKEIVATRNLFRKRDKDITSEVFVISYNIFKYVCCFLYCNPSKNGDKYDWSMKVYTSTHNFIGHVKMCEQGIRNVLSEEEYERWENS